MRLATFNLRYGTAADGPDAWEHRRGMVIDVVRDLNASVLGVQEALDFQIEVLTDALPHVGVILGDPYARISHAAVLYDTRAVEVVEAGSFWLSETPDAPGPPAWDAAVSRTCTWAVFVVDGRRFACANTHFDQMGPHARVRSARLVADWVRSRSEPCLLIGDLNARERSEPLDVLRAAGLRDTFRVVHRWRRDAATYHGFTGRTRGRKIDYVLCDEDWDVRDAGIIRSEWNGRYPSDHYPVTADVELR